MTSELLWSCLIIILGRIADVTLGTVRTISVVRGRKHLAVLLGFAEVFIWIFIVAKVVSGLSQNLLLGFSYATGFAIGNYVGVTVDEWLALGEQATMIISREGKRLADSLRAAGWRLTVIEAHGRDGPTAVLLVIAARRRARELHGQIEAIDPQCFYTVEDVRLASSLAARSNRSQSWASMFVGK